MSAARIMTPVEIAEILRETDRLHNEWAARRMSTNTALHVLQEMARRCIQDHPEIQVEAWLAGLSRAIRGAHERAVSRHGGVQIIEPHR